MGLVVPHALGRNMRAYAKAESTFGTFAAPSASNALKVLKLDMDPKQARIDRADKRSTRDLLERITDRKEISWSLESYVIPSGTAGTAPDIGVLLKAAMGVETVNSGTSVVYSESDSQSTLTGVSLVREFSGVWMEALAGAWVESFSLKVQGSQPPTFTFEGGAADHIHTGYTTTDEALSGNETDFDIAAGTAERFEVGSLVSVGSSTGHRVTKITGDNLEVDPAITGAQASGVAVVPYVPSETVVGSPIAGITGGIEIDGVSVPITAFELTYKNNLKIFNDEAFTDKGATDFVPGYVEITGNVTIRARRDHLLLLGQRKSFGTHALEVVIGSAAGKMLQIDAPTVEFEFSALEVPEAEEATFQLPFRALGASGADALTLTWK